MEYYLSLIAKSTFKDYKHMYIGMANGANDIRGWSCSIAEFSIFNIQKDISDLYNGPTPKDQTNAEGLIAYWKLNDASGSTITDYGPLGFHSKIVNGENLSFGQESGGY